MKTGRFCIEPARGAGINAGFSLWPEKTPGERLRRGFVGLAAVLIGGFAVWIMHFGPSHRDTENKAVMPASAMAPPPANPAAQVDQAFNAATAEAITPAQTGPVDGLKISSQSWRRGGLGSNALVSFTLRNGNDYAVRDIGISCAFARRDGSHLTDRARVIQDIIKMKSRKTFSHVHIGFVNINASKAKCSLVTASHV